MKNPENMTPDERLTRIRSLERKVAELEWAVRLADERAAASRSFAQDAWDEIRRLHGVCDRHWNEKNEYRVAAGLAPAPRYVTVEPGTTAQGTGL